MLSHPGIRMFYGVFGNRRALPVAEIQVFPLGAKMSELLAPPVGPSTVAVPAAVFTLQVSTVPL